MLVKATILFFIFVIPGEADIYTRGVVSVSDMCEQTDRIERAKQGAMMGVMERHPQRVQKITEIRTMCLPVDHVDPDDQENKGRGA